MKYADTPGAISWELHSRWGNYLRNYQEKRRIADERAARIAAQKKQERKNAAA